MRLLSVFAETNFRASPVGGRNDEHDENVACDHMRVTRVSSTRIWSVSRDMSPSILTTRPSMGRPSENLFSIFGVVQLITRTAKSKISTQPDKFSSPPMNCSIIFPNAERFLVGSKWSICQIVHLIVCAVVLLDEY
jgi:hypothetical protein